MRQRNVIIGTLALGFAALAGATLATGQTQAGQGQVNGNAPISADEREPFGTSVFWSWSGGTITSETVFEVPPDRSVVIESVSCSVTGVFTVLETAAVNVYGSDNSAFLTLSRARPSTMQGTHAVQVHGAPGSDISIFAVGYDQNGVAPQSGQVTCSIAGYLVPE